MAKYIPENAQWADITPLLDEIDSGLKHMRFYDERDDYSDFLAEEREDLLRLPKAETNTVRAIAHWNPGRAMTKKTLYITVLIVMNSFTKIFSIRARHLVSALRNTSHLSIVLIVEQKWRVLNELR